jgi:hypothetical protein
VLIWYTQTAQTAPSWDNVQITLVMPKAKNKDGQMPVRSRGNLIYTDLVADLGVDGPGLLRMSMQRASVRFAM